MKKKKNISKTTLEKRELCTKKKNTKKYYIRIREALRQRRRRRVPKIQNGRKID